jgi:putative ABC transport system permease protein
MTWAFNDLKANKGIWAGVLLVLTVTQTILCATGVSMGVNDYYLGVPGKTGEAAKHLGSGLALVYAVAVVLGCLVIMLTLQASIRQRRQGLALLSLLGATPRQVLAFTVTQVFALTMMASVIGLALSPLLAPPILQFHSAVLGLPPVLTFTWHNFTRSALTGLAAGLITALLGAFLTLRDLRTMIPVQLLNRAGAEESMTKAKSSKGKLLFLSAMIVLLLPLAGNVYLSQHGLAAMSSEQIMTVISLTGNGSLLAIILILVALTRSGGSAIGWSTRVWTRLIPARSPAWKIARSQAITRSRGKAFGSSVISLTACLFLVGGLLAAGQTSTAGMRSLPQLRGLSSASPMELLAGFWAALLITLVGAVASFAISAKERNLDLAPRLHRGRRPPSAARDIRIGRLYSHDHGRPRRRSSNLGGRSRHSHSVPSFVWQLPHGLPRAVPPRTRCANYHHWLVCDPLFRAIDLTEASYRYHPSSHRRIGGNGP